VTYPAPPYLDPPAPVWPVVQEKRRAGADALVALGVALVVAGLGFPLGWLWSTLAPHAVAVMTPDGAAYAAPNQEQLIGDEGWYVFLTFLAGLVLAVLTWVLLRRYRGVLVLLGLGVGGVVAGVLTYWTGHRIGLTHARELVQNAPVGMRFPLPVNLRVQQLGLWHGWLPYARGDVLFLAITAVLLYALFAGFSPYPTLRPARRGEVSSDW
jgi:hypothetical protein